MVAVTSLSRSSRSQARHTCSMNICVYNNNSNNNNNKLLVRVCIYRPVYIYIIYIHVYIIYIYIYEYVHIIVYIYIYGCHVCICIYIYICRNYVYLMEIFRSLTKYLSASEPVSHACLDLRRTSEKSIR